MDAPDARLVLCKPEALPLFEMGTWLADYIPEDLEADDSFDGAINALIQSAAPKVWVPTTTAVSDESLAPLLAEAAKARAEIL